MLVENYHNHNYERRGDNDQEMGGGSCSSMLVFPHAEAVSLKQMTRH